MRRDRPPILTERRFDRRLAAMVLIAVLAHFLVLGLLVFLGEFRLRPRAEGDAYTVEVVDGGELGGHLPSGLPDVDIGPSGPKAAGRAKAAPKAPPKPPRVAHAAPPAKPEPEPPAPRPEEAPKPEPAKPEPAKPEPKPEPAKPEVVAKAEEEPDDGRNLIVPATPTPAKPAPPTPRPTAPATPRPTAPPPAATPRPTTAPTAAPTAAPTRRPAATPTRAPARRPTPSPTAIAKPAPTRTGSIAFRPAATPTPRAAARPAPSASPASREAQIADALARVQQRVAQDRGEEPGHAPAEGPAAGAAAPAGGGATGAATGPAGARGGGVGGTDAPDPSRRIGMGPGAGGAGKVRGLEFLLYYNQMIARIRGAWAWAGGKPDLVVKVRFRVQDDGSISDLRVTDPSGDASYDASVLRAVRAVSPLAPPPAAYRNDFADVELTFQPADLQAPG